MDVIQTTWCVWPFIYGYVPNYLIPLTIYLWMWSKLHELLDHLSVSRFQTTWFAWPLSIDVFQTTLFTWPSIYRCVSNCLLNLTIYLWMGLKPHDVIDHYLWLFLQTTLCARPFSMNVFQTTWFTWPFIYWWVPKYIIHMTIYLWCVSNYMLYLTIYLWMCSKLHGVLDNHLWMCYKLHALLNHLFMDVFKTTWCAWQSSLDVLQTTCFA